MPSIAFLGVQRHDRRRVRGPWPYLRCVRGRGDILAPGVNIYECTGLFSDEFEVLFTAVAPYLIQPRLPASRSSPRATSLLPRMRLLLVLQALRQNSLYTALAGTYNVSKSFVARELLHVLPILESRLPPITWPAEVPCYWPVCAASGVIDATAHPRQEVHPGSALYFRTDVRAPNILGLMVVSMEGVLWHASFYHGHSNDQGAFLLSDLGYFLYSNRIRLLSDQIFVHEMLLRASHDPASPLWHVTHSGLRWIVEAFYGYLKGWHVARDTVRVAPERHILMLSVIYRLVARILRAQPFRTLPPADYNVHGSTESEE